MEIFQKLNPIFITLSIFFASSSLALEKGYFEKKLRRPQEELLVIQTVSTDRRTFVVSKGVSEGLSRGQEMIFANENVSLVCKAIEVSRNYSLWIPVDSRVTIPFNKDDFVSSNSHAYGNVALDIAGDTNKLELPDEQEMESLRKSRVSNSYSLKGGFNQTLSQSSSDVSSDKNAKRRGYAIAIEYNYRFLPEFEMNFGARYDSEVYRQETPILDIPTTRMIATIAATYHLVNFSQNRNNFYLTIAAGIGRSSTTISDDKSSGTVTVLPEARIGFLMPFAKTVSMFVESSIESLGSHEKFSSGTQQDTNILNLKIIAGLRF